MADTKFKLRAKIEAVARMKRVLPQLMANEARLFFVASWEKQGFENIGVKQWPKRAKETKKTSGKAILVASGALRRATRNSIRDVNWDNIRLVVDLPYAAIHNNGGTIQKAASTKVVHFDKKKKFSTIKKADTARKVDVGSHTIEMPQRQFMGHSQALAKKQIVIIRRELAKL